MNIELASKVMHHIHHHPDEHVQEVWVGTGGSLFDALRVRVMRAMLAEMGGDTLRGLDYEVAARRLSADEEARATIAQRAEALMPECGTAACFAGHAVLMNGDTVDAWGTVDLPGPDGPTFETVKQRATRLLDLTDDQAYLLFRADNTVDDLWAYLTTWSDGAIVRPIG